jgi:hypothetical protein
MDKLTPLSEGEIATVDAELLRIEKAVGKYPLGDSRRDPLLDHLDMTLRAEFPRALEGNRRYLALREFVLDEGMAWIDYLACLTGDCPHDKVNDCLDAIRKELTEIGERFRNSALLTKPEEPTDA